MKCIVECRACGKDFEYTPGFAGNARQLCDPCRKIADDKEVSDLIEEMSIEKNKYLVGAPKRENIYDPLEIVLEGNFPEFESDADKFICAVEIGKFINNTGICGNENNILKFLDHLGDVHRTVCLLQISSELKTILGE
jgi:hypothetical protein